MDKKLREEFKRQVHELIQTDSSLNDRIYKLEDMVRQYSKKCVACHMQYLDKDMKRVLRGYIDGHGGPISKTVDGVVWYGKPYPLYDWYCNDCIKNICSATVCEATKIV